MAEETKVIRIVVDSSRAVDGSAAATRALERMEKAQGSVASSLDRMEAGLSRVAGFLAGALGARSILAAADAFTRFENALRTAGVSASNMAEISTRLFGAANRNGVEIGALSQLYARASMAAAELGANQGQLLKFVDGVTAGLRLQGGSTESASGALLQLSQALGSGIVRAEEFNSILEGAFPIAQAAARGIDGMGGSVAKLRAAVASGEVTSAKFFDGLLKGFTETERLAAGMSLTVSQGLTVLNNGFTRFVGEVDKSTGFTADLGKALARTGAYMDDLARKQEMLSGKSPTTWINDTIDALDRLDAWLQRGANSINTWLVGALDGLAVAGARGSAMFLEAFRLLPDQLGKLFTDAMNSAIEAVERGINSLTSGIADKAPWLGVKGGGVSLGRLTGGGASMGDYSGGILAAGDAAAKRMLQLQEEERAKRAADAASIYYGTETGSTKPNTTRPPMTMPGKEGEATAERMRKALQDSSREFEQARAFADAANQGADAVARLEVHFKALKTAQDVFGKAANDNTRGVAELTAKLEEQALATLKLKNLGDFRADTATLREQNEILEAEVRLANELPEVRARELAILKTMQEVKAKGLEGETEAIEQRRQAIEQNERLKAQGEEIKRSTELWTAPFKSALESIQRSTADWIESMLEGLEQGKFSFQDFGKIGLSVLRRMAAEIISLAVMRPMLGSVVNGLSSIGVISPATAASIGYGQGTSAGGLSLPGGTGLGGMFGSNSFFSQPIASLFGSSVPAGGYADISALLQSGNTGASASASGIGGLGGLSIGSALGALGGIGMGAYQLFNAKSTGQTIGGIGSMVGAAVSLIPGVGQIAGPIISLASALLPGLFGESNTRTHSSTNASLNYGNGNWYTTGGAWGPNANSGQTEGELRGLTGGIDSVFGLLGGVKDASKVWGLNLNSWTAQGKNWSYTSRDTSLVDPTTGNTVSWRMNMDDMMDTGSAQLVVRSILSGAVGEISDSMKIAATAMTSFAPTLKEVAENITFVDEVYDRLGKGALTVRTQFRELESKFGDMTDTAKKLGLALEPVIAEQKKQTERLGQDYIDNLIDPIAAQLRAWEDEKASILENVDYIQRNTDVIVDQARVSEALLRKEAALKDQLYSGGISQLEDAIKRLTYGDLSNLTGAGTLSGMRASFDATVAQARAGDLSAYQRVATEGLALTDASRGYYASGPEYEAIRREILSIFSELQVQMSGGGASPSKSSATNAATAANLNTTTQLQAMVRDLAEQLAESKRDQAETNDLIRRLLSRAA